MHKIKIGGLLISAFLCFGLNFAITSKAQEKPRERIVEKSSPTATPTPIPSITPKIDAARNLADLQSKIRLVLNRSELRRGTIGVKIVSLETNQTIFEENAEKYFVPASNMKSYTIAAALEKLSPDFRFVTSVYAPAMPDASGVIKGDLTIYGRGDVTFSTAFYDGDYYKALNALAEKIAQAGVKRIEGNLVGDESYFTGNPIPVGWEWNDLQWYYGAEISALPINDNAVDLSVKPGATNAPCAVRIQPANTIIKIVNRCLTVAAGSQTRDLRITKNLDQNILEISGTLPARDKGFDGYIAVSRPAQLFVEMLRGVLIQKGISVSGQNKVVNINDKSILSAASSVSPIEIAKLESPPLSIIAAKTLKPSQNTYTETILWMLGEQSKTNPLLNLVPGVVENNPLNNPKSTSAEKGLFVVQNFLKDIGISPDSVIQHDGSGLSRHNLITPASAVQLYAFMWRSRYANVWRDALTIGATDGTLKNRFKGTEAAKNVRGKTGTIDQVSSLSGYVTTASDEQMVFSIIINGVSDNRARQSAIDEIVVALANFSGK